MFYSTDVKTTIVPFYLLQFAKNLVKDLENLHKMVKRVAISFIMMIRHGRKPRHTVGTDK